MKIHSLIIGKGRGSAGNITVTHLKGQSVLKQKATIVANPRSDAQIKQRHMVNRAVFVWQLIGNAVKQGWTSLLPYASQYNTFVSENSAHFKGATFTKETFKNSDLFKAVATKGSLGVIPFTLDEVSGGIARVDLDIATLAQTAKAGDKLCLLVGDVNSDKMSYSELVLTDDILNSQVGSIDFKNIGDVGNGARVSALWLVSADGRKSTTSVFDNN